MKVTIPMSGEIDTEKEREFEQAKSEANRPQTPEREITKIKAKRSESSEDILINYSVFDERAKDGFFTSSFPCKEEARNEFYHALDATLVMFMEALGLDACVWEEEGVIIGISIKHIDDGYGITLTGKCEIEGRYACPTTPYMILEGGCPEYDLIKKVLGEAIAYLDGARRQKSIFDSI